jgi:hypothetical protein
VNTNKSFCFPSESFTPHFVTFFVLLWPDPKASLLKELSQRVVTLLKVSSTLSQFQLVLSNCSQLWPNFCQLWPNFSQLWPNFRLLWPKFRQFWPNFRQFWPHFYQLRANFPSIFWPILIIFDQVHYFQPLVTNFNQMLSILINFTSTVIIFAIIYDQFSASQNWWKTVKKLNNATCSENILREWSSL